MYRRICNTKSLESADRLYNSRRTCNGSSQEDNHVRFNSATNNSDNLEIKYVGGDLDPSNYPQRISIRGMEESGGGMGTNLCTEME